MGRVFLVLVAVLFITTGRLGSAGNADHDDWGSRFYADGSPRPDQPHKDGGSGGGREASTGRRTHTSAPVPHTHGPIDAALAGRGGGRGAGGADYRTDEVLRSEAAPAEEAGARESVLYAPPPPPLLTDVWAEGNATVTAVKQGAGPTYLSTSQHLAIESGGNGRKLTGNEEKYIA